MSISKPLDLVRLGKMSHPSVIKSQCLEQLSQVILYALEGVGTTLENVNLLWVAAT
jgi:hypothetical protein